MRRFKPNNVPIPTRHALRAIIATLLDAVFGNFSPCTTGFATSFLVSPFFCCTCAASFFAISFFNCSCDSLFFSSSLFCCSLIAASFFALSCCSCAASSFVTVPVSALATEEYPTVNSAIAQIDNSFFFILYLSFYTFYITSHRMYH
ncbi:hypothetical protein protein [Bacillus cereus G9241]|nr:hypothetical protein protein [Bacillus cereus G9241]